MWKTKKIQFQARPLVFMSVATRTSDLNIVFIYFKLQDGCFEG